MKRPALSIALLVASLSVACQATDVQVMPANSWAALNGRVAATDLDDEGALRGSSLDDLGIGERASDPLFSVHWGGGGERWELFGHSSDYSGSGELADDLHLEGVELRFDEGVVDTELGLGVYGLRWVKHVAQEGSLDIGLGASLIVAEIDLDLDQDVLDADTGVPTGEHKSTGKYAIVPFPLPALDLTYHQETFDTHLSLAGMWIWGDHVSGHAIDVDFNVRFPVLDDLGELVCGYRELELELEHSSDDDRARLDVTFAGPYMGFRIGF